LPSFHRKDGQIESRDTRHRHDRRTAKARLDADEEPPKMFGNPWASEKDGKQWLNKPPPKLMRK